MSSSKTFNYWTWCRRPRLYLSAEFCHLSLTTLRGFFLLLWLDLVLCPYWSHPTVTSGWFQFWRMVGRLRKLPLVLRRALWRGLMKSGTVERQQDLELGRAGLVRMLVLSFCDLCHWGKTTEITKIVFPSRCLTHIIKGIWYTCYGECLIGVFLAFPTELHGQFFGIL